MKQGIEKIVVAKHTITIQTAKRCSNDCSSMDWRPRSVWCNLFGKELKWDTRYKANGYKRCAECRKAEYLIKENKITRLNREIAQKNSKIADLQQLNRSHKKTIEYLQQIRTNEDLQRGGK